MAQHNLIETHAHIYSRKFDSDREEVIDRAKEAGISRIYMPNVDSESIDAMMEVEHRHPYYCIAQMGIHPCSIKKETMDKELYVVEDWLNKRKFSAVGEIGIDLYWDKSTLPYQTEAFKIQIEWAKQKDLPIVIHARESMEEIITVLEEVKDDKLKGVLHCFSGNLDQAERLVNLGFYLGIGGVSTFKNGGLDQVIPSIDLKHLVVETDCPYLAPVPHRGKRNEPSYVQLVAERIADLKGTGLTEVAEATTKNALDLFAM